MKSDAIRMRSCASITGPEATPSATPDPSRRSSPVRDASPTLAPDPTTQLSYNFEDSGSFRAISVPTSCEFMGALGALAGAGPANHVGDTTHRALYQTPSSPYNLPFSSVDSVDIGAVPSPFKPYELAQMLDPNSIGALADGLRGIGTDGNTQHIRWSESSHKPSLGAGGSAFQRHDLPNTEAGKTADDREQARHLGFCPGCPYDNLDSSDGEPCELTFSVSQEFSFSSSSERDDDPETEVKVDDSRKGNHDLRW